MMPPISSPGWARTDDEHVVVYVARAREPLRMPTAAIFLARGRVLGAYEPCASELEARQADVAADALANLVHPSLLDLRRQEGVRNRGARRADDVQLAGTDRLNHRVRIREPTDTDDRLLRVRSDLLDPGLLIILGPHARGRG
jgi:hypothetical protein